jgi:hypothetical protein
MGFLTEVLKLVEIMLTCTIRDLPDTALSATAFTSCAIALVSVFALSVVKVLEGLIEVETGVSVFFVGEGRFGGYFRSLQGARRLCRLGYWELQKL